MRTTNENGFAFSMDALCAFLAICAIALVSLEALENSANANARQLQYFELEKNAIMVMDALVKNRNAENSALGAAAFNEEKKRVEENKIDTELLKRANPQITKNVFLKRLALHFKGGREQEILDYEIGAQNCLGIERLVLAEGKKALLEGVVCVE